MPERANNEIFDSWEIAVWFVYQREWYNEVVTLNSSYRNNATNNVDDKLMVA